MTCPKIVRFWPVIQAVVKTALMIGRDIVPFSGRNAKKTDWKVGAERGENHDVLDWPDAESYGFTYGSPGSISAIPIIRIDDLHRKK